MGFNPDDYVDVATRLALFWDAHPDGRIHTDMDVSLLPDRVTFRATVWTDRADDSAPASTGWASERLDVQGRSAEATNPVEVCETSAIGRALANFTFQASANRPSLDEMRAAEAARNAPAPLSWEAVHHRAATYSRRGELYQQQVVDWLAEHSVARVVELGQTELEWLVAQLDEWEQA